MRPNGARCQEAVYELGGIRLRRTVVARSSGSKPKLSAADAEILLNGQAESAIDEGISGAIACVALLP